MHHHATRECFMRTHHEDVTTSCTHPVSPGHQPLLSCIHVLQGKDITVGGGTKRHLAKVAVALSTFSPHSANVSTAVTGCSRSKRCNICAICLAICWTFDVDGGIEEYVLELRRP